MSVILISGTIGAGKSSLTDMLAKEIDSKPFYENVEDNEVLPLFYSNPEQYDSLLDTMLNELDDVAPKKRPDLMVHIKVSLDTMLERIKKRGRDYEQLESDETLYTYYETLNTRYNQWYEDFDVCPKIQVDGDTFDFVENPEDAKKVIRQIQEKLAELEGKPAGKYFTDNQHAKGQELG